MKIIYETIILIFFFSFLLATNSEDRWRDELINISESYPFCKRVCQECGELNMVCRDLNLTDFKLIQVPFSITEKIVYTGNSLGELKNQIFSKPLYNLTYLDLSNNKITSIRSESILDNLSNLKYLILDDNYITFESKEDFLFLRKVSNTLEYLSLNNNSRSLSAYQQASLFSQKLADFLRANNLYNLKNLEIKENVLIEFYSTVFCSLPSLQFLSLEKNFLKDFDFNLDCVNNSLNYLNLKSNSFNTINTSLLIQFKELKKLRPDFEVYLSGNPFKCDCNLYGFYKFLKQEQQYPEKLRIFKDGSNLMCTHTDSLQYSINKTILDSNLQMICAHMDFLNTTKLIEFETSSKGNYVTLRNRTRTSSTQRPLHGQHSLNKLAIFLFCSLIMCATILLGLKIHYRKLWNNIGFKLYKRLPSQTNAQNFNRLSFEGASSSIRNDQIDDIIEIPDPSKKTRFNFLSIFQIFKRNDNETNLRYNRFDFDEENSSKIYNSRNRSHEFSTNSAFSITKKILKREKKTNKETDIDTVPIVSVDENSKTIFTDGIGVLGVKSI